MDYIAVDCILYRNASCIIRLQGHQGSTKSKHLRSSFRIKNISVDLAFHFDRSFVCSIRSFDNPFTPHSILEVSASRGLIYTS